MGDKATRSGTLSDLLIEVVTLLFFVGIVVASVLVVDVIALWLLNLLADLNTWLLVLLIEGAVMMAFGVSGIGAGTEGKGEEVRFFLPQHFVRVVRGWLEHTEFRLSIAIAGVMLLILGVYLVS